jgi:hypothetical protein
MVISDLGGVGVVLCYLKSENCWYLFRENQQLCHSVRNAAFWNKGQRKRTVVSESISNPGGDFGPKQKNFVPLVKSSGVCVRVT